MIDSVVVRFVQREMWDFSKKKENKPTPKIKIVSLGESRVGKSCLIKRFCEGNRFVTQYIPTIGIDYGARQFSVDNIQFYAHFWDMSGDDSYFEVRNEFYGDTDGFLLVFDLSVRDSFTQLNRWIDEAKRYGADLQTAVLCGNKSESPKIVVTNEEATSYAKKLGVPYFETSAKTGKNVPEAFTQLFRLVIARLKNRK
jgi:small GTP-binding protein